MCRIEFWALCFLEIRLVGLQGERERERDIERETEMKCRTPKLVPREPSAAQSGSGSFRRSPRPSSPRSGPGTPSTSRTSPGRSAAGAGTTAACCEERRENQGSLVKSFSSFFICTSVT